MEKLFLLLFDIGLFIGYIFIALIAMVIIQYIGRKVFKINLYKKLIHILFEKNYEI